jgi:hypothetical protein
MNASWEYVEGTYLCVRPDRVLRIVAITEEPHVSVNLQMLGGNGWTQLHFLHCMDEDKTKYELSAVEDKYVKRMKDYATKLFPG